jgi:protein-S-isoprenylcysteine O-methyltransferase Ste14
LAGVADDASVPQRAAGQGPRGAAGIAARLARWRVPLGFVSAAIVFLLARPTWSIWRNGLLVALVGEAVRVWAAGHLEKSREVTASGPYRFVGHPLYVGSSILGAGVAIASGSWIVAALVTIYCSATVTAAVRTEEAFLRSAFAQDYASYQAGAAHVERRFALERAMRNREYRAVIGLAVGFALLAIKIRLSI